MEKQEGSIHSEGVPEGDRTEEALRRLEEKYRFLFERSPAVNLIIDADGRIRDVTNSLAERLGYSNDEILGRQALEFVVAEQRETVAAVLEMAFKGQDTPEMDVDIYAKDGSVHTVFFSPGQAMLKEEDQPTGVLFTGADITERKQAEKALREREEQYRLLIERQREGLTIIDLEEQFVFCNPAGEEIFGVPRGGLVGRNVSEFTTPETFDVIRKQTEKRRSGESSSYEIEITRPDGEKRQLLTTATPWLDKDGRVIGALAIFRDETERKRAEEALRESEKRYRGTLDSMLEGCQFIGFDWRYLYVNDAVARQGRRTKDELLNHTMMEVYPGIEDTKLFSVLKECMEKRVPRRMENEFTFPDGTTGWFDLSIQPVPEGIFILSIEITERKRAEEKLRTLHKHATQLSLTNTIDEIVRSTLDAMESTLGFDHACFGIVDKEVLHIRESRGMHVSASEFPLDGPGVMVKAANTKRTLRIADTRKEPVFVDASTVDAREGPRHMLSELVVPVLMDGKAVAVLNVESTQLDAFTEVDQRLLETLAIHVSSSLNRQTQIENLEQLVQERTGRLAESEKRFRELAELLPQIVFEIDDRGNLLFANRITFAATGYAEDDLRRGLNAFQMFATEDHDRARQRMGCREY
jgi:PAS domain S-box-containing protein